LILPLKPNQLTISFDKSALIDNLRKQLLSFEVSSSALKEELDSSIASYESKLSLLQHQIHEQSFGDEHKKKEEIIHGLHCQIEKLGIDNTELRKRYKFPSSLFYLNVLIEKIV
jgi:hypothetical protein